MLSALWLGQPTMKFLDVTSCSVHKVHFITPRLSFNQPWPPLSPPLPSFPLHLSLVIMCIILMPCHVRHAWDTAGADAGLLKGRGP